MPDVPASSTDVRYAHVGVIALTVLVFAAVVAAVTLRLRPPLREQILRREADMLAAIASMQLDNNAEDAPGSLLVAVLRAANYRGVLDLRVFDANRQLKSSLGAPGASDSPDARDWERLAGGEPVARWHRVPPRDDLLIQQPTNAKAGVIEAWVPLHRSGSSALIGAAQFWMNDAAYRNELERHDERLWRQALVAWLAGSAVIVLALSWAFRRLDRTNRQLRARSEDLQRANRELVLAAKTSALGAVTAHLMHELKNPLAGLEVLVGARGDANVAERGEGGGELAAASELTRRLRTMVNDIVGVLRDEQTGADFELSGGDIAELVRAKVQADAAERGVSVDVSGADDIALPARRANLVTLVLRNLAQNALEASPRGSVVKVSGRRLSGGEAEFVVEDRGPGLPESVRARLFQPCASTKIGGSGLGLALSYQLAAQAGGRLELAHSDERGTSFRLVLAAQA
jgi:signal transduction histidine kinase